MIEFTQSRYCAVVREDLPTSSDVITVSAKHNEGGTVKYSIIGGNTDGLFNINEVTGVISLAASLDYEVAAKHEIVVSAEIGGQIVHVIVQVSVTDVNDNPPVFINANPQVTIIEEDDRHLPASIIKVQAEDKDQSDSSYLFYSLQGDGVDGYDPADAYFTINSHTGDIFQLRAVDRDPPNGKRTWILRVKVEDGQKPSTKNTNSFIYENTIRTENDNNDPSWFYEDEYQNDDTLWSQADEASGGIKKSPKYDFSEFKHYSTEKSKELSMHKRSNALGERVGWKEAMAKRKAWNLKRRIDSREMKKEHQSSAMTGEIFTENHNLDIIPPSIVDEISLSDAQKLSFSNNGKTSFKKEPSKTDRKSTRQRRHQKNKAKTIYKNISYRDGIGRIDSIFVLNSSQDGQYNKEYSSSSLEHSMPKDDRKSSQSSLLISEYSNKHLLNHHHSLNKRKEKRKNFGGKRKLKYKRSNSQKFHQKGTAEVYRRQHSSVDIEAISKITDSKRVISNISIDDFTNEQVTYHDRQRIKPTYQHDASRRMVKIYDETDMKEHDTSNDIHNTDLILHTESADSKNYATEFFQKLCSKGLSSVKINQKDSKGESFKYEQENNNSDLRSTVNYWELPPLKRKEIIISPLHYIGNELSKEEFFKETFRNKEIEGNSAVKDKLALWYDMSNKEEEQKRGSGRRFSISSDRGNAGGYLQSKSMKEIKSRNLLDQWLSKRDRDLDHNQNKILHFFQHSDIPKSYLSTDLPISHTSTTSSSPTFFKPSMESTASLEMQNYMPESHKKISLPTTSDISGVSYIAYTSLSIGKTLRTRIPKTSLDAIPVLGSKNTVKMIKTKDTDILSTNDDQSSETVTDKFNISERKQLLRGARNVRNVDSEFFTGGNTMVGEVQHCPEPTAPSYDYVSKVVHSSDAIVTVTVKDINDNPPVFPNSTMYGEIQENGSADQSVMQVSAWDTDDATEGTNARITYFIEKNVIHDKTGDAIFKVHSQTGLITTALCCLDRETTPEFYIQVVAADGGGLKGTGTVVIRLADENDNYPRLTKKNWQLEVNETYGEGPLDNATLLEMTAVDPDSINDFSFRIVQESGSGWDRFNIRWKGSSGQLYAIKKLDFEDPHHLQGFKFMVQVTDRGEEGWADPRYQDSAWIGVKLKDLNDNPPSFQNPNAHLNVNEDTPPGTLLFNMTATDPDTGGGGRIKYEVLDGWDALKVIEDGGLILSRPLDRESRDEGRQVVRVVAIDEGSPSLTSTGTLTITVVDVNDCPPMLKSPTVFQVLEGESPVSLGVLTATDDDVWSLGHGPPFTFSLAPSNPGHIHKLVELNFDRRLDSGRGGAELWTREPLDREEHRQLQVEVLVMDAGGLNSTETVTIVIGDLNDNPMKSASKVVYLWKTPNAGSDAPLGRVYVDDPDDWDVADKTFQWAGKPHPLFALNEEDGTIYASTHLREGRYDLQFLVNDQVWNQVGVSANVSVVVKVLTQEALAHATPINLFPTTPALLTREWKPSTGGGILGKLIRAIRHALGAEEYRVEVVSVYGTDSNPSTTFLPLPLSSSNQPDPVSQPGDTRQPRNPQRESPSSQLPLPYACVWMSALDSRRNFMDPVKLQGFLALNSRRLEQVTGLSITFNDHSKDLRRKGQSWMTSSHASTAKGFRTSVGSSRDRPTNKLKHSQEEGPETMASLASTVLPLQVVDTNKTSLVTPLLLRQQKCPSERIFSSGLPIYNSDSCTASSCLNGGRCVPFPTGSRCICPGGSKGPQCKIVSRSFKGNGWVWLSPLPSCLPATISFRLLTTSRSGLLLYSGPLVPPSKGNRYPFTSMLTVQLVDSKPQLLVENKEESVRLQVNSPLSDGEWHTLHARLDDEGVAFMVDICGLGWAETSSEDSHCVARQSWSNTNSPYLWESVGPLQVGGIAHPLPTSEDFGWKGKISPHSFDGCLSHLTINNQIVDLGEPPYNKGTVPGCQLQESACKERSVVCGIRGECTGGLGSPQCQCNPGWSGQNCDIPTIPTTLGSTSYMKIALSYTPPSKVIIIQIRVRTLGARSGTLLHLANQHTNNSLTLQLRAGIACSSMSGAGWGTKESCVEGQPIGDGKWHTIRAERYGHNLLAVVDDGDEGRCNHSLPSLTPRFEGGNLQRVKGPPMPLEIDKHDGILIGGRPIISGSEVLDVEDDLQDTCIDDLRVSGRRLPLPPTANGSSWGQVTSFRRLTGGCHPPSTCSNTTCGYPLSCHADWRQQSCSCSSGKYLVKEKCVDVDECLLEPCLHGGTCANLEPGYRCLCGPNNYGDSCEWTKTPTEAHSITAPVLIGAVAFSFLLLVIFGLCLCFRHHRIRTSKAKSDEGETTEGAAEKDLIRPPESQWESTIIELESKTKKSIASGSSQSGNGNGSGNGSRRDPEDESHSTFLDLLKISRKKSSLNLQGISGNGGEGGTVNDSGGLGSGVTVALSKGKDGGTEALPRSPHSSFPLPLSLQQLHLPQEDLRNYAYEGDGSSSGSLASTISGLQAKIDREEGKEKVVVKEFVEVVDLLQNLPDAPKASSLKSSLKHKRNFSLEEAKDTEGKANTSSISPALCGEAVGVPSGPFPARSRGFPVLVSGNTSTASMPSLTPSFLKEDKGVIDLPQSEKEGIKTTPC